MELINNSVWILRGNNCFAVFSLESYAEEFKKEEIGKWENSIIRDSIPNRLNNRAEIEKYAKYYPEVIFVNKDHYSLVKGWSNMQGKPTEYWYYELMSNAEWDEYYKRYISHYIVEKYIIVK